MAFFKRKILLDREINVQKVTKRASTMFWTKLELLKLDDLENGWCDFDAVFAGRSAKKRWMVKDLFRNMNILCGVKSGTKMVTEKVADHGTLGCPSKNIEVRLNVFC